MSADDIMLQASCILMQWDGRQFLGFPISGNNVSGQPNARIVNSYNVPVSALEMSQQLAIGPLVVPNVTGPTYLCKTTQIILADTSGGALSVTFPDTAYPGMLVIVKDFTGSFPTHNCTVVALGGQEIENFTSTGSYATSQTLSSARSYQYCFDGGSPGKWFLLATA